MANSDAGTSSSNARGGQYQVFLNFCGRDTRDGFTSFLHRDLVRNSIHAFIDEEGLGVGEEIGEELLQAIDNSQIYIPIFSKNYADSKWCLRELARMVDNTSKSEEKKILPVFYDVEPDDIELKTPVYRTAIEKHKEEHKEKFPHEVESWEKALKKVNKIKGWVLRECKDQAELVDLVVKEVLHGLKRKHKFVTEDLVGLDVQVAEVLEWLDVNYNDEVRLVGLHGMGGIGKTTLARVIYNELSSRFGKCCAFLDDVRETSKKEGLVWLQKKLLREIDSSSAAEIISGVDHGRMTIEDTLGSKKVLIVLDDVDMKGHIENLMGQGRLHPGTRIIVTTRNTSVLKIIRQRMARQMKEKNSDHALQFLPREMKEMNSDLALQLFKRRAFFEGSLAEDFDCLSKEIVSTTGGLPLALEVISSLLCEEPKAKWENTLKQLKKIPHKDIQETLMISYDALNDHQREIFLDVACFFINADITNANYMWEACEFHAEIEDLVRMSLIKIKDNRFWMHDQLRDLGREIVRRESRQNLWEQSRLWTITDVLDVIRTDKRKKKVKAIDLWGSNSHISIINEEIERFESLRFLRSSNGTFLGDSIIRLPELRWMSWNSPLPDCSVASMHSEKLVVLELFDNHFTDDSKVWDLIKMATKLKVLALVQCHGITRTPNLSKCLALERLTFDRCRKLKEIDSSIGKLTCLRDLNITNCELVERVPDEIGGLVKLERFSLKFCYKVRGLPTSIGDLASLRKLDLSYTGITSLLGSIRKLRHLSDLNLKYSGITEIPDKNEELVELRHLCLEDTNIKQLPDSIGNFKSLCTLNLSRILSVESRWNLWKDFGMWDKLEELDLGDCGALVGEIPYEIGNLSSLRVLNLQGTRISGVPGTINKLSHLSTLDLTRCDAITELPELPVSLVRLRLGSRSLKVIPNLSRLTNLVELVLGDNFNDQKLFYSNLMHTCDLGWIGGLSKLKKLDLSLLNIVVPPTGLGPLSLLEDLYLCGLHPHPLEQPRPSLLPLELDNFSSTGSPQSDWNILSILTLGFSQLQEIQFNGLLQLQRLSFGQCDLQSLSIPSSLTKLRVYDCPNLIEIQFPGMSASLELLRIVNCGSIERIVLGGEVGSVGVLSRSESSSRESTYFAPGVLLPNALKKLKKLDVRRCENLLEIQVIGTLLSLQDIFIQSCDAMEKLSGILNLKNLHRLFIHRCFKLRVVEGLDKLEFLMDLVVQDCPSLETLLDISNSKIPDECRIRVSRCRESLNSSPPDVNTGSITFKRYKRIIQQGAPQPETNKSEEEMEDEATQRAADMETSDRDYAIAAVQKLVGIDDRVKQITELLEMEVIDEVRIIGIYGTDGIGKTTLAKAVYDRISSCFDRCSFLAEVEETTRNPRGIQFLQAKLIRDILERDREDPSFDGRIECFLDVFREMKVLIVVDDVEKQSHLHAVVGERLHWFGPGSRIILTSKNSGILKEYDPGKARTYMVRQLDNGQAFELFCKYAYRMQSSVHGYDGLANRIVNATVKLPLVVEVIGSFLRGKSIVEWKKMEELMKQSLTSSQKTMVGCQEILDICYKALEPMQKYIFLDIACFISGVDAQIASYMWPNLFLPSFDCILMPLAKIGENNELQMHRLLRRLGKRILDQEESEDPIPRKFYIRDMVPNAISREKGMENVEALCFDLDDLASCTFTAEDFESMPGLRFLKLDNAKVSGDFAGAFPCLRWLCWQRCPLDFGAINFVLRELVIFDLSWSKVTEDWGGWSEIKMEKLKVLNLTGCSDLLITPDFSYYKDLEILILESCPRLVKLDSSIGHLKRLLSLNLKFCSQLSRLPVELGGMKALKELFIDGTSVREIPISIGNLKQLKILSGFKCFPLTRLPSSISNLTALSVLSLDGAKITELPSSLGEMLNLKRLSLRDCRYMQELPDSIGKMGSSLEELDISATSISKLPNSIRNLQNLRVLRMNSSFIRAFPGEIGNLTMLEELHASWCRSLKGAVPSDIKRLHHLRSLKLGHSGISSLPSEISTISSLHTLDLLQCNEIEVLPELPPSLICLRVSSKRLKPTTLLKDLKELEELCLSDEDPKEHRPPSKQLMPESKGKRVFSIWFSRLWNLELLQTQRIDKQSFSISSPKLRKLELSLSQIMNLHFVYEPTDIPQLKTLTLSGLSLEEVSELPKTLSVLSIQGCSSLKRLPTVQGLTNMSVFELYHSAIEEIEGLEGLKALKRLDISICRIQNLNGIGQLTSLRSLILSDCDYLDNLPDLSNLKLLKVLEIRQCKMIHQIEGLEDLTSLEELNISECPAEYLVEVQNALKHVVVRSMVP